MQLVEQHVIKRVDPRFALIDSAAFAAKNLYNAALYEVRQSFIFQGVYLSYPEMDRRMQAHKTYKALPAKVAQWVLRALDTNWQNFFAALSDWQAEPMKLGGRPRPPKYKDKQNGRTMLVYTIQAISQAGWKQGLIQPSRLPITIRTQQTRIAQVRIVPRNGFYVVGVVKEQPEGMLASDPAIVAVIDSGVDNLAAITSNKQGFTPCLFDVRLVSPALCAGGNGSQTNQSLGR